MIFAAPPLVFSMYLIMQGAPEERFRVLISKVCPVMFVRRNPFAYNSPVAGFARKFADLRAVLVSVLSLAFPDSTIR